MKYLKLKPEAVRIPDTTLSLSTADVIRAALNDTGQGVKLDEMRARMRVLDRVDEAEQLGSASQALALEDADAKVLQRCVQNASWTRINADLLACLDAIQNMPGTPPE